MSLPKFYVKAHTYSNISPYPSWRRDFDYWQKDLTTNLYYLQGNVGIGYPIVNGGFVVSSNVGIGTNTPTGKLDVVGNVVVDSGSASSPSFTFRNNNNTGIYQPSNNVLAFSTNANQRMILDAYGNVGIGSFAPSQQLDVSGNINYTGDLFKNGVLFSGSQWNDGSNNIIYYNTGNIGIGSSNPQGALDVSGNIMVTGDILPSVSLTYNLGSDSQRWKDLYLAGNTIDLSGTLITRDPSTNGIHIVNDEGDTLDAKFNNVTCDGNLGVGGNFTVQGTFTVVESNTVIVEDPVITLGGFLPPTFNDNMDRGVEFRYYDGSSKLGFFGYDDTNKNFVYLSDASNNGDVFSGNFGNIQGNTFISMQTDSSPLTVNSTTKVVNLNVDLLDGQDGSYYRNVDNINNGTLPVTYGGIGTNTLGANRILVGNSTNPILSPTNLTWNGNNLGVGTSVPIQQLDVSGNIHLTGDIYQNGVLFTGGGGSSQWIDGSNNFVYYDMGNVGIGTSAPTQTLDVTGTFQVTNNPLVKPFIVTGTEPGAVTCTAAIRLSGTGIDTGYSVCTDPSGNLYVTGSYTGSGVTVQNLDGTSSGKTLATPSGTDMFLLKYNTSGTCVAAIRLSGTSNVDIGYSVCTDPSGNLYVTGCYFSTATVTVPNLDGTNSTKTLSNNTTIDIFILKYANDASGTCVAAILVSGTYFTPPDEGRAICTDSFGNLYVTGQYNSTTVVTVPNLDGTNSTKTLATSTGGSDAIIIKYDTAGTCVAAIRLNSSSADTGYSVCTDPSGNLYVTGYFAGTGIVPNLDGTASTKTLATTTNDMFLLKYANDASGTCVAAILLNGTSGDYGYSVCTDPSGNLYVTGSYTSTSTVTVPNLDGTASGKSLASSTNSDMFLLKYNTSGTCVAAVRLNGTGNDIGYSVCTDLYNNLYVTGQYISTSTVTVPNMDGTTSGKSLGATSSISYVFVLKYNASGKCTSAIRLSTNDFSKGYSVCTDLYGNLYVTGNYQTTTTVTLPNLDGTSSGKTLSTNTNLDAFILKYSANQLLSLVGINKTNPLSALDVSGNIYMSDGTAAAPVLAFGSNPNTGLYRAGTDILGFTTGGTERVQVDASGNVGIGITSPSHKLVVNGTSYLNSGIRTGTGSYTYNRGGGANFGQVDNVWLACGGVGRSPAFIYAGGDQVDIYAGGGGVYGSYGYFSLVANVSQIDFTGQHRSHNEHSLSLEHVGLIVISSGLYKNLNESNLPSINEALPIVQLARVPMDKRVYGVLSDKEEDGKREYELGRFVSVFQKEEGDNRLIINSLGEGGIWVCNANGNFTNGDYITSSSVAGYGMRQDDDVLHSYTVAKITCDCDFTSIPDTFETRYVLINGVQISKEEYIERVALDEVVHVAVFVGCTYHCG